MKLSITDRDRRSTEAGLKTAEAQAEEQRQKLHYNEIELATYKQQVVKLKAELLKAQEAAQGAADAAGPKFYNLGVQETEARLTEKLTGSTGSTTSRSRLRLSNVARVPTDLEWRKSENTCYLEDLREALEATP